VLIRSAQKGHVRRVQMEDRFHFHDSSHLELRPFALCPNGHRCIVADASTHAPRSMQCPDCGADFIARGPFDTAAFANK
jgi:hypothetical protein